MRRQPASAEAGHLAQIVHSGLARNAVRARGPGARTASLEIGLPGLHRGQGGVGASPERPPVPRLDLAQIGRVEVAGDGEHLRGQRARHRSRRGDNRDRRQDPRGPVFGEQPGGDHAEAGQQHADDSKASHVSWATWKNVLGLVRQSLVGLGNRALWVCRLPRLRGGESVSDVLEVDG